MEDFVGYSIVQVAYLLPSATKLRRLCFYLSVCPQGGVCLSTCWDATPGTRPPRTRQPPPPQDQAPPLEPGTPLGPGMPPGPNPPWTRHPPRDQAPPPPSVEQTATAATVCILLECILVLKRKVSPTYFEMKNEADFSVSKFNTYFTKVGCK